MLPLCAGSPRRADGAPHGLLVRPAGPTGGARPPSGVGTTLNAWSRAWTGSWGHACAVGPFGLRTARVPSVYCVRLFSRLSSLRVDVFKLIEKIKKRSIYFIVILDTRLGRSRRVDRKCHVDVSHASHRGLQTLGRLGRRREGADAPGARRTVRPAPTSGSGASSASQRHVGPPRPRQNGSRTRLSHREVEFFEGRASGPGRRS